MKERKRALMFASVLVVSAIFTLAFRGPLWQVVTLWQIVRFLRQTFGEEFAGTELTASTDVGMRAERILVAVMFLTDPRSAERFR